MHSWTDEHNESSWSRLVAEYASVWDLLDPRNSYKELVDKLAWAFGSTSHCRYHGRSPSNELAQRLANDLWTAALREFNLGRLQGRLEGRPSGAPASAAPIQGDARCGRRPTAP